MVTSSPSKARKPSEQNEISSAADSPTGVKPASAASHPVPSARQSATKPPDKTGQAKRLSRGSLREQKKARARKLILDAAQTLIQDVGYAQTKMRDVAFAADMSYQTLYNYFPTKGLILQELLMRDLLKLDRATFTILHSKESPTTKLRDLAKSYIDAIAPNERDLWKEVCAELLKATSDHSCLLDLLDRQALNKLENALSHAQSTNELDPHIEATVLAQVIFSLIDASLMRYLVNERITRASMLASVSAQLRFCITPYLR